MDSSAGYLINHPDQQGNDALVNQEIDDSFIHEFESVPANSLNSFRTDNQNLEVPIDELKSPANGVALYLMFVKPDEVLHFANGCLFFSLRDAISRIVAGAEWEDAPADLQHDTSLILISREESVSYGIGPAWLIHEGQYAVVGDQAISSIMSIAAKREGHGTSHEYALSLIDSLISENLISEPVQVLCN